MDAAQPKRRLKAFLKHATIRISSAKDHGFANDSASTHSIDDDGSSQKSSNSAKKDSKLRRIGRGIREWRSKRRRLHGDTRPKALHTLEGKSFSSSEASLPEGPFENEDFTDDDEPVDRPEDHALKASEDVQGEAPEEKLPWEVVHEEVVVRQGAGEHVTPREFHSQTQSRKEETLPQTSITIPSPPIYSSSLWPEWAPPEKGVKTSRFMFRRDRKRALDFAQNTLMALQRAGILVEGTFYISSDSDFSLEWVEKAIALATVIRKAAEEARALEADVDGLKYLIRLSDELDRWQLFRSSDCICPEKSMTASIGRRILEQYHGLRWPAPQGTCRLLRPASAGPSAEIGDTTLDPRSPSIRAVTPPSHNIAFESRHQGESKPQPPPPSPQPQLKVRAKKQRRERKKRPADPGNLLCTECWHKDHLIQQCFERFPEQKIASPQRYARYAGHRRLEEVVPGAFDILARLHPQLVPRPAHGQDTRYMIGRVGISPHLTPRQCAVWAVRYQAAQSVQSHRQHLREKYRWDEAQGAELD